MLLVFFQWIYSEILIYNLCEFQKLVKVGSYSFFLAFKFSNLEAIGIFEVFFEFGIWSYGINSKHLFVCVNVDIVVIFVSAVVGEIQI